MCHNRLVVVGAVLSILLISGSPVVAGYRTPDQPLPFNVLVSPGTYEYFQLNTIASNSAVTLTASSNAPVSTAFMTATQFTSFNDSQTDLSDSLYLQNGTSAQDVLHEPIGTFYLVFYAYANQANVSFNYEAYPTDPYFVTPLPAPEPTGVASFGITNNSGTVTSYQVKTTEVAGIANVTALAAYNATAGLVQSNISGVTLQLNSVLVVNESDGQQQSYWIQDTPDFVTSASQVAYGDNVWNFSVSGILSNATVTSSSGGAVYTYPNGGTTGYYYSFTGNNMTYSLPFELLLVTNENVVPGQGVLVQIGAQLLQNGAIPNDVDWFDNVTIHDPLVTSAYYYVSGNGTTSDGLYYDTEFVFAGEANGEATDFTQLSASLGIFYANPTNGTFVAFPSLYSFGGDTAESADNLQVTYSGKGFAQVTTGTPDYVYLGSASGTVTIPLSSSGFATSSQSTGQVGTASNHSSGASSVSSSSPSSSSSGAYSIAFSPSYLAVLLVAGLASAAAFGMSQRRRTRIGQKRESGYLSK